MNILQKILGHEEPVSAAEIAKALETARADRIAAASHLASLAERRAEALVTGTDVQVDKIEAEQTGTARRLDRLDASIARLETTHVEAESREAREQLEQQASQAEKAGEALDATYAEVDGLSTRIRTLLASASGHADVLRRWNSRAEKAGMQDRRIGYVDPVAAKQKLHGAFR